MNPNTNLIIFLILFIGYSIYIFNRKAFTLLLPNLLANSIVDSKQAGLIITIQHFSYAISKFISGILSDKISTRILFSTGLFISGAANVLFANNSNSLLIFIIVSFSNGIAQGFGWPSAVKFLRKFFSTNQFATYFSILTSSSNLSGALCPYLGALITINFGWRYTALVFGFSAISMSFISFTFINANPKKNKEKHKSDNIIDKNESWTWIDLLKSRYIWSISFVHLVVSIGRNSACDWGQLYLLNEKGQSPFVASSFISFVEFGGLFGVIFAGYLTDMICSYRSDSATGRLPVAIGLILILLFSLHTLIFHTKTSSSQFLFILVAFFLGSSTYGTIAIFEVIANESVPDHLSGTSHAIVALAANVGAIISSLLFTSIEWNTVFILLESITLIVLILLILVMNRFQTIKHHSAMDQLTINKLMKKQE